MRFLRNVPIQRKLTLIIMLTCGVALALGALALALRYAAAEQDNLARHMAILTRMAATNSTSALAFKDPEWARRTLAALDADPAVCAADILDAQGKLFASFRSPCARAPNPAVGAADLDPAQFADDEQATGLLLLADSLRLARPIVLDEERIGTIVLVADLEQLRASLLLDAAVLMLIVMVAGLVALLFASQLQKFVSEPIRRLATTMKHVSVVKDYSRHVAGGGDDELGSLICGFNEMLDQIRLRDEKLQLSRDQLMTAHQIAQLGDWEWDAGADRVLLSDEACTVFGITAAPDGLTLESFLQHVHGVDREWVGGALVAALGGTPPLDIEHRVVTADGTIRYVHQRGKVCPGSTARTSRLVGTAQNVTERAKAEEDLRITAKALENTVDSVMVLDADRHIVWVNKAFTLMTGYGRESVLGQRPELLNSDRHPEAFYDDIWSQVRNAGQWQGEVWSRRRNGEIFPQRLSISPIRDQVDQVSHYVSVSNDISPYKQYEAQLEHLAHHDTLTQLFNRGQFETRLRETLARASRQGTAGAVMFVDLDHFKAVNDTCGHSVGDQLLRAAAERIRQCVRESDIVARLGGDEFAILLDGLSSPSIAAKIAGNLAASLAEPFNIAGKSLQISSSIGISCYPDHGRDADTLLLNADQAMYRIKDAGRNGFSIYSDEAACDRGEGPTAPECDFVVQE